MASQVRPSSTDPRLRLDRRRLLAAGGGAAAVLAGGGVGRVGAARRQASQVRLATSITGASKDSFDAMLGDFMAGHPEVEVIHESTPPTLFQDKLATSLSAGDPPDAFRTWVGGQVFPYVDAGLILDPTPYYEQYNWEPLLIPWALEAVSYKDKVWGVPRAVRGMGFWYRTDLFADNGLAEPTTYEELEQLCQSLKTAGITPLSLGGKFGWNTMRLTDYFLEMTAGPELHDRLARLETSWDDPAVVEAYRLLQRWGAEAWIVPDFLNVDPSDARLPWYQGSAAMVFEGDWMEGAIKDDDQDIAKFDFFLPPTGHEPLRYSAFPEQFVITSASTVADAAAVFLDWYIQPETQNKYFLELGGATASLDVGPDPEEWPRLYKWRQILESSQATYLPADQSLEKELYEAFFEVQDSVIIGMLPPEEGATEMQLRVEEFLAG